MKGKYEIKLFACFYPFSESIAFLCPKSDNSCGPPWRELFYGMDIYG